jgi:hypothetical protein
LPVSGLLQMSTRQVKGGVASGVNLSEAERIHRYSKAVVSLKGQSVADWKMGVADWLGALLHKWALRWRAWTGLA